MTCILGYVHDKGVTIGGDSCGTSGTWSEVRLDPKVFKKTYKSAKGKSMEALIGFTSSFRMGQVLMSSDFKFPQRKKGQELYEYLITDWVDEVRKVLKDKGYAGVENNEETGGEFLLGIEGRLFNIHTDFQIAEPSGGIAACGAGGKEARAILVSLLDYEPYTDMTVEDDIEHALTVVSKLNNTVRGPFIIKTIKGK